MSDDAAVNFAMVIAGEFLVHAKAIIGAYEPIVVSAATWSDDGVELNAGVARWIDPGVVLDYIVEPDGMLPNRVSRDHVLELLARTYRVRSSRVNRDDWVLPGIPERYQELLEQRFPVYVGSGLEVGPGWYDLLWALGEWLREVDPGREPFMQVKEKFGEARLYGLVTDAEPIVEAAELLSRHICDVCGKPGSNREVSRWMATRCAEHRHA